MPSSLDADAFDPPPGHVPKHWAPAAPRGEQSVGPPTSLLRYVPWHLGHPMRQPPRRSQSHLLQVSETLRNSLVDAPFMAMNGRTSKYKQEYSGVIQLTHWDQAFQLLSCILEGRPFLFNGR